MDEMPPSDAIDRPVAPWVVCGACSLRHRRREDGLCPRCKEEIGEEGESRAEVREVLARNAHRTTPKIEIPEVDASARLGHRITGGFLLVWAIDAYLRLLFARPDGSDWTPIHTLVLVTATIDLGLSGFLLVGNRAALPLAYLRVLLGAVLFSSFWMYHHVPKGLYIEIVAALSLLILLIGRAKMPRIVVGTAVLGSITIFSWVLLYSALQHGPLFCRMFLEGQVEEVAAVEAKGRRVSYSVQMPNDQWFPRKRELIERDWQHEVATGWTTSSPRSPVDAWNIRVDYDAHIITSAAPFPNTWAFGVPDMKTVEGWFVSAVALTGANSYRRLEQVDIPGGTWTQGSRLLFEMHVKGFDLKGYSAFYIKPPHLIEVHAWAPAQTFHHVEQELIDTIDSFVGPPLPPGQKPNLEATRGYY